jgi:hypothetical protein
MARPAPRVGSPPTTVLHPPPPPPIPSALLEVIDDLVADRDRLMERVALLERCLLKLAQPT